MSALVHGTVGQVHIAAARPAEARAVDPSTSNVTGTGATASLGWAALGQGYRPHCRWPSFKHSSSELVGAEAAVNMATSRDQLVLLGRRFNVAAVPGAGRRPSCRAPSSVDTRLPRLERPSEGRAASSPDLASVAWKSAAVWLSAVIWSAAAAVGEGPKSYVTGNLRVETSRVASQMPCPLRSRLNERSAIGKMPKSHVSDGAGPTSAGSFGAQEVIVREK